MDVYLLDWANLLLRWLHVVVAIAWVGSSFYFVLLDNSLTPPEDPRLKELGVTGELWAVHGGGFYNPQKYALGPKTLPKGHLHWFYWESYWTWMSGFALLIVLYLFNAEAFLIDRKVFAWQSGITASAAALAYLAAGWIVYDLICRFVGRNKDGSVGGDARVGVLIFIYVCAATWLACQLFTGRAAFVLTGAMLATIMSANVFFWIIPGQRIVVADLAAGRRPDPVHGQRGKQRSVHNTYFTLPVLVAMLSNHYGMLWQHPLNWLVLIGLMLLGALVRAFFVLRHKGPARWELVFGSVGLIVALMMLVSPRFAEVGPPSALQAVTTEGKPMTEGQQVQNVLVQRCVMCHNAQLASKNVRLDSPQAIAAQAQQIHAQVNVTRLMPLNNATQMTAEERALVARWFAAGAKLD
ncbi:MAG TPA: urate hydroxylase PuuD [Rubrivivax sp.]|nr:urate hydroxylase PuuD [Rubrivivax sp.]